MDASRRDGQVICSSFGISETRPFSASARSRRPMTTCSDEIRHAEIFGLIWVGQGWLFGVTDAAGVAKRHLAFAKIDCSPGMDLAGYVGEAPGAGPVKVDSI